MTIYLKECSKPHLSKVKFNCDEEIHKKLNDYELTKSFFNRYNTTLLIGKQGSGKTSLLVNFVKKIYKKCFHYIYIFIPKSSRASIDNNIFEKYLPPEQIYDELTEETIDDVYEKIQENTDRGFKSLIIYDDVQKSLKNPYVLKSLKNIIANQRHLKVVNLILLQNYFSLDKSLRELVNNVILFKLNKTQTEKVFSECVEFKKEKFEEIRKFVFNKPYQWLFINLPTQRIFKNFDEILDDDDDDDAKI